MRARHSLAAALIAAASLFSHPIAAQYENYTWGPIEYPPAETIGFNLNHFSLLVGDMAASMHFYTQVLGMREMFTYHAQPYYKVAYLGHPSGGRNGTGYQTPLEMLRDKNNMQGLLELLYLAPNATDPPPARPLASSRRTSSFSHMGVVVPDLDAARRRLVEHNVTILADVDGKVPDDPAKLLAALNAYGAGLLPEGSEDIMQGLIEGLTRSGQPAMMIEDPDGNIIEVQAQY
jgi:lactoylglutathione lyase